MYEYSVKKDGKNIPKTDEKILVCFLKMLDFSSEYLHEIYEPEKIKFCPEEKVIYLNDSVKHSKKIDITSQSYGFKLKNQ